MSIWVKGQGQIRSWSQKKRSKYKKIETYLVWYQIKGFDKRNLFRPVLNVFGAIQIKGTG